MPLHRTSHGFTVEHYAFTDIDRSEYRVCNPKGKCLGGFRFLEDAIARADQLNELKA